MINPAELELLRDALATLAKGYNDLPGAHEARAAGMAESDYGYPRSMRNSMKPA